MTMNPLRWLFSWFWLCIGPLYLFGSKSSSTTQNTNITKTNNQGFSEVSGDAMAYNIEGSNNTLTDYGAVRNSLALARDVVTTNRQQFGEAVGFVTAANQNFTNEVRNLVNKQSQNNDERMLTLGKWIAGAVVVVGGIAAWRKGKN